MVKLLEELQLFMHILVAFDRSRESDNALVSALDIIDSLGGNVTVVHAVGADNSPSSVNTSVEGGEATGSEQGHAVLREAVEQATKRDISIETELLVGDPVEVISDYAEQSDVDAIYVGHRGFSSEREKYSDQSRGPLGSIAKGLVEATEVPVTVFDRGL